MRYLLYLPGLILLILPFALREIAAKQAADAKREKEAQRAAAEEQRRIEAEAKKAEKKAKAAERERVRAIREADRQRKQAERLEVARLRAEYAERELAAMRELKALQRAETVPAAPVERVEPASDARDEEPEPVENPVPAAVPPVKGNGAFKGHVVSFTGRLPGMTRREAIQAVQDNGGRAYEKMPAGTTILVVGDKPGMCKMDKADEWIGQVRKITAKQFFDMLNEPPTVEIEDLMAKLSARNAA